MKIWSSKGTPVSHNNLSYKDILASGKLARTTGFSTPLA